MARRAMSWAKARNATLVRARGRCEGCGIDCLLVERIRARLEELDRDREALARAALRRSEGPLMRAWLSSVGWSKPETSYWETDHVLDRWFGGSDAPENLRNLCQPCHARKSAARAKVRAKAKRVRAKNAPATPDAAFVGGRDALGRALAATRPRWPKGRKIAARARPWPKRRLRR